MILEDLSQPVFDYVCEIRRVAHSGGTLEMATIRKNLWERFEHMREASADNAELSTEVDKVKLPLIFYVDYMIKEGPFSFKDEWQEIARQYNELSGDEKFFDILDETLNDPSVAATTRLKILYHCMGTGFNGCYNHDPDFVERKMKICALRIGCNAELPFQERISEECYQRVHRKNNYKDPSQKLRMLLLCMILALIVGFFLNLVWFYRCVKPLDTIMNKSLTSVNEVQIPKGFLNLPGISESAISLEASQKKKVQNPLLKEKTPSETSVSPNQNKPADPLNKKADEKNALRFLENKPGKKTPQKTSSFLDKKKAIDKAGNGDKTLNASDKKSDEKSPQKSDSLNSDKSKTKTESKDAKSSSKTPETKTTEKNDK